jgi:FkbM family methyltransferase
MSTDLNGLLSAITRFRSKRAERARALSRAQREASSAQRTIEQLRARLARQSATAAEAREAILHLEARLTAATARLDQRRRNSLTPDVLADLLPLKASSRFVLSEDRAAAGSREARLIDGSDAYRLTSGDEATRQQGLERLMIGGIPWWIPRETEASLRAERAVAQGFPLRAILQTRELSIGGVMLDLGANIGRTSIPRVLLGDVRAVYAAEPEPSNYACLVQNVIEHGLRGSVLPDQVAIGDRRGEVMLRQSRYMGGHRVLHTAPRKAVPMVAVPLTTVDDWMARMGVDPAAVSFVKVDTQGSEITVLRGAGALLALRRSAWQIEIDPGLLTGAGYDVPTLLQLLQAQFTHAIDLGTAGRGPRVRPASALAEALGYLGDRAAKTDVLVYNAARTD